jgi:tetratricopeptide (TPR) repeat protein
MLAGLVAVIAARYDQAAGLARRGLDGFRSAGDQWGQTMALELLGVLARRRGAYAEAVAAFEEALGVVRDLGLRDEVPFLLVDLGGLYSLLGDYKAAGVLHAEALDLARERGAGDAAAHAQNGLASGAGRQGDYDRARDLHQAALSFYREAGFAAETARTLVSLGHVEELRGDLDAAESRHQESLRLARDLPDELPLALALEGLASLAVARRQPGRAVVLLGAAGSIRTRTGTPSAPQEQIGLERAAAAAVSALGAKVATAERERGRRMTAREAAAYASPEDEA